MVVQIAVRPPIQPFTVPPACVADGLAFPSDDRLSVLHHHRLARGGHARRWVGVEGEAVGQRNISVVVGVGFLTVHPFASGNAPNRLTLHLGAGLQGVNLISRFSQCLCNAIKTRAVCNLAEVLWCHCVLFGCPLIVVNLCPLWHTYLL